MPAPRPFVVQQSFPDPRPTTNPYLVLLRDALAARPGLEVRTFRWRRALLGRYDVFHVHWPEILLAGSGPARSVARHLLTVLLLLRWWLTRVAVVRTRHNIGQHEGAPWWTRTVLALVDRATTADIVLNPETPATPGRPRTLVPHGDYRSWFSGIPRTQPCAGRLSFVGLVRPYKGVEHLIEVFGRTTDTTLTLRVAGRPHTVELARAITELATADPRVGVQLAHLTDLQLVSEVTASELVVLPYREMHNSGGALAALSLDRPVLVPDNPVTRALAAEVGDGWVHTYRDQLAPEDLVQALHDARRRPPTSRPDLTARTWTRAGADHELVYRHAVDRVRGGPGRRPRWSRSGQRPGEYSS